MVNIDFSVVIQIINFIVLIWVLNMVLYKPIRSILRQRKEKIVGLEEGISNLAGDAEEKDQAFTSGVRAARTQGMKEKEAILQEAAEEEKKIIGEITRKAQEDLSEVKRQIASEADEVRQTLLGKVDEYANTIGAKILGREMA